MAVGELERGGRHEAGPLGGGQLHAGEHVPELPLAGAGVHGGGAAQRAGDAGAELGPHQAGGVGPRHEPGDGGAGREEQRLALAALLAEVGRKPHHHPAHAAIRDQGVGPAAQHRERHAELAHAAEQRRQVLGIGRAHQEVRRPAHLDGGARGERLVGQALAAQAAPELVAPAGGGGAGHLALEEPEQLGAGGGDVAGAQGEHQVAGADPRARRRG